MTALLSTVSPQDEAAVCPQQYSFILAMLSYAAFEVTEEMVCVVSIFSHLLQDLPHGELLTISSTYGTRRS